MVDMRKIGYKTGVGALLAVTVLLAMPSYCADVGMLPSIGTGGAGNQLGTYTYDTAVPGAGFAVEFRGSATKHPNKTSKSTSEQDPYKALPKDPAVATAIEGSELLLGVGFTRSFSLSLGLRQVRETIELPEQRNSEGELIEASRKVSGASRSNVNYAASIGLVQTSRFGFAMTGFGSSYADTDSKPDPAISKALSRQPSYSLPLKPAFGLVLHSVLRLSPLVNLYGNLGDRYHNEAKLGATVLGHEPFVQTLVAFKPLKYVQLMLGLDARWLQLTPEDSSTTKERWHSHSQVKYGAKFSWRNLWLEAFAKNSLSDDSPWVATGDSVGLGIGLQLASRSLSQSRQSYSTKQRQSFGQGQRAQAAPSRTVQPRVKPLPRVAPNPAARYVDRFSSGRQRWAPKPRAASSRSPYSRSMPQRMGQSSSSKAWPKAVAPRAGAPKTATPGLRGGGIHDIRDAERVAREARYRERLRQQAEIEAAERATRDKNRAYLDELNSRAEESFPEIDNLPDITDEEYFWNGLDDG